MGVAMLMMFGLLYSSWSTTQTKNPQAVANVLASTSLTDKINYIIQERQRSVPGSSALWIMGGATLALLLTLSDPIEWIWNRVFPSNVFLFGKRKETFDRQRALLDKIFWIVGVGLGW
jgi:hypothetical protein